MEKNTGEIICIAHLVAKNGQKDALFDALQRLIRPSRSEPGCISYQIHCNLENPNMFTFIDRFKDQTAFNYHCEAPYIKEAFDNLIPALVDSMEITVHQELNI